MLDKATALSDEIIRLRRIIHANPELSFREYQTAALIADTLGEIGGYRVRTRVGKTGVVADLGDSGPLIAIRADMDALPIVEANDEPYCSCNPGVMHACGHDAHTAILLGVAHLLRQSYAEETWNGRVRLLFQPAEEDVDENQISGATAMINDRALEGVDAVIALHVSADKPSGRFMFQDGPSLAAVDSFDAWIRGDGAHGAYPHTGSDPIYMLAPILTALYAIPSRRINPLYPSVVSVGQVSGGATTNVIPNEVTLAGSLRCMNEEDRRTMLEIIPQVANSTAEAYGCKCEVTLPEGYPCTINDGSITEEVKSVAIELIGEENVTDFPKRMTADDFGFFTANYNACYYRFGVAGKGDVGKLHTSTFLIDEESLRTSTGLFTLFGVKIMQEQR